MTNSTPDDFDRLLTGLRNHPRSLPRRDLMPGIMEKISRPEAIVVPLSQWRALAAAAVILLLVNLVAILYYGSTSTTTDQTYALVSNYVLYE